MTAVIPKGAEGATVKVVWDAMGMRGTASDNIEFEETFVPREDIQGGENYIGALIQQQPESAGPRVLEQQHDTPCKEGPSHLASRHEESSPGEIFSPRSSGVGRAR